MSIDTSSLVRVPGAFYGKDWNGSWVMVGEIKEAPGLGEAETMTYTTPTDSERYCPDRILKSGNRTIVVWSDGTKTIVKRSADEADNDYAAFTAALAIKIFGSNSALRRMIRNKVEIQKPKEMKKQPYQLSLFDMLNKRGADSE